MAFDGWYVTGFPYFNIRFKFLLYSYRYICHLLYLFCLPCNTSLFRHLWFLLLGLHVSIIAIFFLLKVYSAQGQFPPRVTPSTKFRNDIRWIRAGCFRGVSRTLYRLKKVEDEFSRCRFTKCDGVASIILSFPPGWYFWVGRCSS